MLRPEPGNAATAARIEAAGGRAIRLPLFAVRPLAWLPPDPAEHDALFLTSANAVRAAGPALAALSALPVHAVGRATAAAAQAAGLQVAAIGDGDGMTLAKRAVATGTSRALHLAGRDRSVDTLPGTTRTIAVYASEATRLAPGALDTLHGAVALLHSPRAARRLAELIDERADIPVAAISAATADAAGTGWGAVRIAARPDDDALVAAGLALA